jgi:hypothetical protein
MVRGLYKGGRFGKEPTFHARFQVSEWLWRGTKVIFALLELKSNTFDSDSKLDSQDIQFRKSKCIVKKMSHPKIDRKPTPTCGLGEVAMVFLRVFHITFHMREHAWSQSLAGSTAGRRDFQNTQPSPRTKSVTLFTPYTQMLPVFLMSFATTFVSGAMPESCILVPSSYPRDSMEYISVTAFNGNSP